KPQVVLDRHVLALNMAGLAETLAEGACTVRPRLRRRRIENSDHWHRRLLRPRRQRPGRRSTHDGDELAAPHSITSSARAMSAGGTVRPMALAVARLMTSSSLLGNSTGRSAGFSPFKIRST